MRLERYITEAISNKNDIMAREDDPTLDRVLTTLEKDCKPYLSESNKLLYRGSNRPTKDDFINKHKPRNDRRPLDTRKAIHDFADDQFNKRFGWKARSQGTFVSTVSLVQSYGKVGVFFPIGKYKYVWADTISDFTMDTNDIAELDTRNKMHLIKIIGEYTDKGLKNIYRDYKTREISFYCPNGYYLVNPLMTGELSYYFQMGR